VSNTIKIHKYVLSPERQQVLDLPRGARPIKIDVQPANDGAHIVLWALVLERQPTVRRAVVLVKTGDEIDPEVVERCDFVGTVQVLASCRRPDGTVTPRPVVEHVWIERDVAAAVN
jgi:hypothetical protein